MAKGVKTGGRKRGTPNKRTLLQADEMIGNKASPLEFLLKVMWNSREPKERRMDAAKAAAPFCHSRLQQVQHGAIDNRPIPIQITPQDEGVL